MNNIIIVGNGETARLCWEYFTFESEYEVIGFAVDLPYLTADAFCGLPVYNLASLPDYLPPDKTLLFVAVSFSRLNRDRADLYLKMKANGYTFASFVSPNAYVSKSIEIGENCLVLENNTIQSGSRLGNNVIIWSGNHIGHRSVIGDHVFISSHCVISGFATVSEYSFLGVNCTVEDEAFIGHSNFLGANTLVRGKTDDFSVFQQPLTPVSKVKSSRLFRL
jgi:sugar O-acyltransferase (sialic acid O-acetyltransferase NeuD family)